VSSELPGSNGRPLVGVFPRGAREERRRLFDALEQALDVRFAGRESGEHRDLIAAIVWQGHEPPPGVPCLMIEQTPMEATDMSGATRPVRLHDNRILDQRLRRWEVGEATAAGLAALAPFPHELVLASERGRPLWVADQHHPENQRAVLGPDELWGDEVLRDRLCDGRFLGLLPLVELARRAAQTRRWQAPALGASFLLDDPNLHWPTYGHVKFRDLAQDALIHEYHVGMATVPLDAWMVHPGARAAFVRHPDQLSLIIHGNEHVRRELARRRSDGDALALARQALARATTLERRARLPVGRIMAPPHGVCSPQMGRALLQAGFEALTISRAYPWLEHPPADRPLAGWRPAEFVAGGLPVIERRPLRASPAELAMLAYLDHPLIVFGHHDDVADGPERLREIRGQLTGLGPIRWSSIERLARRNFATSQEQGTLRVRLYSRCVDLDVPEGVERLVVELPGHPCPERELVACGTEHALPGEAMPVRGGSHRLALRRYGEDLAGAGGPCRRRPIRVWPILRRGMVEARDRSRPVINRIAARRHRVDEVKA
jgi:hypothetical protein